MAPAAALVDELVEQILLRIPPDDPKSLLRAALVCKRWGRVASDPGFRRRFAEFHRTAPMLGFLCSGEAGLSFAPTTAFVSATSFRPFPARLNYRPVDARHGRVLLHDVSWSHERRLWEDSLVVWDPITGAERARLPLLPQPQSVECLPSFAWNAAVLCASVADNAACDHLDCHRGHFLVVFVSSARRWGSSSGMCALVYSSEAAAWSQPIYAPHLVEDYVHLVPSALAGDSLFYPLGTKFRVLKFDVATREMSLIDVPQPQAQAIFGRPILMVTADGGLGLARLGLARVCQDGLQLWSRQIGPDEDVVWAQCTVIKLEELLRAQAVIPDGPLRLCRVTGSAHGLDVILVSTSVGVFTVHLKSVQVTKHWEQLPLLSDQEQAPKMPDEHKILYCGLVS